ncbi:SDR family oxidoreductase [Actinoplanes sp. RD1]|uniref:SDR family oxidoreductase n=1 Tax=Actinoplanes sp. RD1 TaxID=3064538 RepID=UPI00274194CD|nr:NAD(P)H-binding protein [Actinoplanes sp. RD1]
MIVVTGASGNVGRPLIQALVRAGEQVTAVSRHAVPGVRHRSADLTEPGSLRSVLSGASALFLLVPGAGADVDIDDILDAVKANGVGRVVLLSSQAAGTRPESVSHAPLRRIEEAVGDGGTILRPGGFASNAMAWAGAVRSGRPVAAPFGDVGLPVIDPADIAEVAAVVLRGEGHAGRVYELTGPALSTPRQRVRDIGAAIGRPVNFVEQSPAEARAEMSRFMPPDVVTGTLDILGSPRLGELRISPDVRDLLGREPQRFADWATRHADAFRS